MCDAAVDVPREVQTLVQCPSCNVKFAALGSRQLSIVTRVPGGAARALGGFLPDESARKLLTVLTADPSTDVRDEATNALGARR